MLFTFVVLFLTLGFDLAYGQEQKENEKVTVTLDFSEKGAFGLKNNTSQSVLTDITGQRKSTGGVFYFIVFCIFAL